MRSGIERELMLGFIDLNIILLELKVDVLEAYFCICFLRFEKWETKNRLNLMLIKASLEDIVSNSIPDKGNAEGWMDVLGEKFKEPDKDERTNLIRPL